MGDDARRAAELAVRESYGRIMAFLSVRSRDVAVAEDALAEAFRNALETWPVAGVPREPEAWLLTAARRRLIDQMRHARVHEEATPSLLAAAEEAQGMADTSGFPDDRLKLLFVCAHPGIDPMARTPLMLQTVLGLDAARIAAAFLVRPATMGQRLSRVKTKIRDAGIPFEVPSSSDLPNRLDAVAEAIYAAYGSGWD
ncbi:MAG: RNA polymerase subunit sigma-70, partial [Myxococcota bacterium]|nr:RNA polymerase subunit sigma-70 [Myxococcota bacterium]